MALICIAGMPECPKYAHASFVADFLTENLPNFKADTLVIDKEDWQRWLMEICNQNNWHHYKCPVVWKELVMRGGKRILIGGLSEFLEFCYEYYGLNAFLTEEQKKMLIMDNVEHDRGEKKRHTISQLSYKVRQICISGASCPMVTILLGELLRLGCLGRTSGTTVTLYDLPEHRHLLEEVVMDVASLGVNTGLSAAQIADDLPSALRLCDVFILLDDYKRNKTENLQEWLGFNRKKMHELADLLNDNAQRKCRVILANPFHVPICFNATILAEIAINICIKNIVVITADAGLDLIPTVAKKTNTNTEDIACPPVWGFIGINQLVDIDNMLYRATYFVPNKRALKNIPDSSLPQGTEVVELRKFRYMLHNTSNIYTEANERKVKASKLLRRDPGLTKVQAIIALLRLWYSDKYDDEIISLGVCSDGTFGITAGLFFSQPVILRNKYWTPCSNFPLPEDEHCNLESIHQFAVQIVEKYGINDCHDVESQFSDLLRRESSKMKEEDMKEEYLLPNAYEDMIEHIFILKENNNVIIDHIISKFDYETESMSDLIIDEMQKLISQRIVTDSQPTIRLPFKASSTESMKRRRERAVRKAEIVERERLKKIAQDKLEKELGNKGALQGDTVGQEEKTLAGETQEEEEEEDDELDDE